MSANDSDDLNAKIMKSPACAKLAEFIVNVYPKRDFRFCTSWSSYSICLTDEEDLINEVYAELYPEQEGRDWLSDLPSLLLEIAAAHRLIHVNEDDDTKNRHDQAFITFCKDAIEDLFTCHLNEI